MGHTNSQDRLVGIVDDRVRKYGENCDLQWLTIHTEFHESLGELMCVTE
jgi:hypothetical protein